MNPDSTNDNEKDISANSSISSDLIRGHINTIILRTLYDGDKYGYEIINEIEEKSKGQYTLKQPTLYSALKRLESQDFLTSYWGGVSNGGRRKYFQITDKGRKVVEQNLAEWEYSRTVIDSLISERDYDFNNPPPSASVDFNILKKSTSRVPVGKGDEEDFIELGDGEENEAAAQNDAESAPAQDSAQGAGSQDPAAEFAAAEHIPATEERADTDRQQQPEQELQNESVAAAASAEPRSEIRQHNPEPPAAAQPEQRQVPESPIAPKEEVPLSDEEKQRIHENYKVLIGDDTDATSYYYTHVAQRNREDRNTFDSSVFGNAPREEYAPQQPVQEPAYEQPPQGYYTDQQANYYYAPPQTESPAPAAQKMKLQICCM